MLDLHIVLEKEGDLFSALCLELNVASQGKTVEEAEKNIKEAVELYLKDVYAAGDEKEFVPRPAPVEEWLKYFRKEAEALKEEIIRDKARFNMKEVVVG